jgi:DNA repair protein RadC
METDDSLFRILANRLPRRNREDTLRVDDFKRPNRQRFEQQFGALGAAYYAVLELHRRALAEPLPGKIQDPLQACAWAKHALGQLEHEELWCLMLSRAGRLICARRLAQGGAASLSVSARDVLRAALRDNAHGVILLHNHPGGDAAPSEHDQWFTTAIHAACNVAGLTLLDHIIVAEQTYTSMRQTGVLRG